MRSLIVCQLREHPQRRDRCPCTTKTLYYNFLRLGKEGYRKIHTACYDTAKYISAEIEKLGPFEIIYNGQMDAGIPALCWKMKEGAEPGFSLYDLADRLRSRGWQVPAYALPANRQDLSI
jgi:glutamate decarboxylase